MAETDARTEADGTEPRSTLEREEDRAKIRRNRRKKGLLIVHT
jgi:hypothetical protein